MVDSPERIRLPSYLIGTDLGSLKPNAFEETNSQDALGEIHESLDILEQQHRELTDRVQENEKSYNSFSAQFQPGRTYVQTLLYKVMWEETITIPTSVQTIYPGGTLAVNPPTGTGFDVSNDLQHAYYKLSAFCLNTGVNVLYQGGSFTISTRDVILGVVRNYKTAPPRLETFLTAYNNTGADQTLKVKVYREIGIT